MIQAATRFVLPALMRPWLLCLWLLSPAWIHAQVDSLYWQVLTELPPAPGETIQPGLAGAFIGLHNDALLIAGGANFPKAPPWEGGAKAWHQQVYVLEQGEREQGEEEAVRWVVDPRHCLPAPRAYGLSISLPEGLLCIGGNDAQGLSSEVWLLRWHAARREISLEAWPSLPLPLANMTGARLGDVIYLLGGESAQGPERRGWALDISSEARRNRGWQSLPPWPGPARTHAMAAVQQAGEREQLFLFGGRRARPDSLTHWYSDAFSFDPNSQTWTKLPRISHGGGGRRGLAAGSCLPVGSSHILLIGGDQGHTFRLLEGMSQGIQRAIATGDPEKAQRLTDLQNTVQAGHKGFSPEVLAYHTITRQWVALNELPQGSPVTTTALKWGEKLVVPTGEIAPGLRTPAIWQASWASERRFGWVNYTVLALYLLVLVYMGIRLSRQQRSTHDFFKGGGRVPWWAAGLSIFGTQLSAITFMAIPAKAYATDWLFFFLLMSVFLAVPVVIRYFLPFFRRLDVTTAYEYLELRFNLSTRILGSAMFAALQLGRLGIVLLLPSLALSVVTGMDVNLCILTMGVLSIAYTVLGGIEAVIWTDVIQVVVLLGGALLVLVLVPLQLEGGMEAVWAMAKQADKLRMLDVRWDFTEATLWVVLMGGFFSNLIQYGSDQTVIQRFLTTPTEAQARKSLELGALMVLPSALIFFSIGTALFAFFAAQPQAMSVNLPSTDATFPWYIVTQLPEGISGLLIAAIFAAAMSSLDSSMNSVATVATTDFYRRFVPRKSERHYLRFARLTTLGMGALGTLVALYLANGGVASLWDTFNTLVGLFAGGLGGLFVLGLFVKPANGAGALVGLAGSGLVQYLVSEYTSLHFLMYACTGVVSAVLLGYLASRLFARQVPPPPGLTYEALASLPVKKP